MNGPIGPRRRAKLRLVSITVAALAVSACSAGGASPSQASIPSGVPVPSDAVVMVGQGGGYDSGDLLYGFSSNRSPAAALDAYSAQLQAAGFRKAGLDGSWVLFQRGGLVIAVRTGASGPPTDLLVRILSPGRGVPSATSSHDRAGGNGNPPANGKPSPSPKSNGNPNPGAGGNGKPSPSPKSNGNPNPGAGGNPNPGANGNGNPNPGAGGNPNPGAGGNPNPGAGGNPNPGTNPGNPNPGTNPGKRPPTGNAAASPSEASARTSLIQTGGS